MKKYFHRQSLKFDFVLFTSYERQLESLLNGDIDVAWNGPLAHVRLRRVARDVVSLGMRDVDRDFVSYIVSTKASGIHTISDLRGKRLATGAHDSPQAYVVPMHHVLSTIPANEVRTIDVTRYDKDLGKHGDTAEGEVDVIHSLRNGTADAGFVSRLMYDRRDTTAAGEDLLSPRLIRVPLFDHCQFDALPSLLPEKREGFRQALMAMDWNCAEDNKVMVQEGIKERWEAPRENGYDILRAAIAKEEVSISPPALHSVQSHPFKSLISIHI
jgi:ABC-type phosphate/phosphonate transport system substrate-binding protein